MAKRNCCRNNLKKANVDIAVIPETEKKLKCSQELEDYILLYSGVPTIERAAAGIAIMIKAKFKKRIHCYMFVNERIFQLRYKLQRGYLTLLAVYTPEEGKTEQTEEFYETPQDQTDKINKNDCSLSPEIVMQEFEKFLLMESWAQMVKALLTLSVLMLQISSIPSTAEPANVSYLQRYADLHLATLISVLCLFSAQCLNTESILKGSRVIYCL